jgi:hypothetical protein
MQLKNVYSKCVWKRFPKNLVSLDDLILGDATTVSIAWTMARGNENGEGVTMKRTLLAQSQRKREAPNKTKQPK